MAEETLYDSEERQRFAGIELGDDRIPDVALTLTGRVNNPAKSILGL